MPNVSLTAKERYLTPTPRRTSEASQRSPHAYNDVIDQAQVTLNPRYLPAGGETYCNIFAKDVMAWMQAALPYWVDTNGNPTKPFTTGAREQSANRMSDWLAVHGRRYGWEQVDLPEEAQSRANLGHPTLAIAPATKHGHVVVVRPGSWVSGGPWCAQAGKVNSNLILLSNCFRTLKPTLWSAP